MEADQLLENVTLNDSSHPNILQAEFNEPGTTVGDFLYTSTNLSDIDIQESEKATLRLPTGQHRQLVVKLGG
jgi:hypothetical protein